MEPNSPKKIQFAVPLFQSQIDPEAAEQVRKMGFLHCFEGMGKRRPTPASLVIMNEHMPPALAVPVSHRLSLCSVPLQSQGASPKQRKQSVFTPPALKG
ncbi:PPR1C phosphatase, partial [Myiagra hebetior]|nr:PPR1C phosphatase [Myiagra hebetior]